jgi:hypothetical protein
MLDNDKVKESTENLRNEIQKAESKLKIQITQDGSITPDCLIDLIGTLKSEMLSMKCDIILCRAVIFAQDLVIASDPEVSEIISQHASQYMDTAADRIRNDAAEREKNTPRIIQASSLPT